MSCVPGTYCDFPSVLVTARFAAVGGAGMFAESIAVSERPDVRPLYETTAVFSTRVPTGSGEESTTTWKVTVVDCPAASVPPLGMPVPAPAPVPSWKATAFVPEKYSPWSASTASVFVPAFAPETIRSDPG